MENTTIALSETTNVQTVAAPAAKTIPKVGFEIILAGGETRHYETAEAVRSAILAGVIPKFAPIRTVVQAAGGTPVAVEGWAKSQPKLRSVYAPIWSLSLKGALIGFIAVGILKSIDTLVALGSVNPGAAFLWLLWGAAMFSPKWKLQLFGAALFLAFNAGANFMMLWGMWFGVAAFAAVFGISAGMFVGTVVGLVKARGAQTAPDAAPEGPRPIVLGIVTPLAVFVIAAVAYVQLVMPALLDIARK